MDENKKNCEKNFQISKDGRVDKRHGKEKKKLLNNWNKNLNLNTKILKNKKLNELMKDVK